MFHCLGVKLPQPTTSAVGKDPVWCSSPGGTAGGAAGADRKFASGGFKFQAKVFARGNVVQYR